MPAFVDSTTSNPYIVIAHTKRLPAKNAAGQVLAPVDYLPRVQLHIVQQSPVERTELRGAIPFLPFIMESMNESADIDTGDEVIVDAGPFAGTYKVSGATQTGYGGTTVVAEKIKGT